jgi:hypothetical protein
VLHVHIAEGLRSAIVALRVLLERTDIDSLGTDLHAVELFNSGLGGFLIFKMNKTKSSALTLGVLSNLAGKNISEQAESVVESLVVDVLVQVLNIYIRRIGSANSRVTVRPHNSARVALDIREVQSVQSALGVLHRVKVDIGITKRSAGDTVSANTDACDGSHSVEHLVQHILSDLWSQIANVEGGVLGRRVGVSSVGRVRTLLSNLSSHFLVFCFLKKGSN